MRVCRIFQQLPQNNYRTTAFLFAFLNKVASYSAINKMGYVNLATVCGPIPFHFRILSFCFVCFSSFLFENIRY